MKVYAFSVNTSLIRTSHVIAQLFKTASRLCKNAWWKNVQHFWMQATPGPNRANCTACRS